ncbi:hypothetical protein [Pseudotabrizicola sp.]|uniref:hypothetical protein n=1 Tax=Pseudotabrizicola sp. TaxID=2939647 RepID=UPI00271CC4E4|nr:hypothetical protein [Pseudotabrizicola sp.]MDO8885046.1 hypothetical protein [Pseudotabrizicola sp.]
MRQRGFWALIWGLALCLPAGAEPITVSIIALVPEGGETRPVSWSAVPLDLPEDADVIDAMIMTPEPVDGPWQVALEPGDYVISGFTEAELYETTAAVTPQTRMIEVPVLAIDQTVALRCAEARCDFTDEATGLHATLPEGWAVDAPYFADLGDGALATEISTVFFEDVEGDGGGVWFLNPVDWITGDTGPCRTVELGNLCTFDLSPAAEAAFSVIAPALRLGATAP